jgi:hypothetical protein
MSEDNVIPSAIVERDRASTMQAALYGALAKAQGDFPKIPKNRDVQITMKSGGKYRFKYADLEAILSAVRKPLASNGLAVVQTLEQAVDGPTILVTQILHAGGGRLLSDIALPKPADGDPKAYGAVVTYFRRYALSAMLNIAADDDLDEAPTSTDEPSGRVPELIAEARAAAASGTVSYKEFWSGLSADDRKSISALHTGLKKQADEADAAKNASGAVDPAA